MRENKNQPRAVILARVSSVKQGVDKNTLEMQVRDCKTFIDREGWTLCREPFKLIESGSKDTRELFDEAISYCLDRRNHVDYLVVREISRFTRQGYDVYSRVCSTLNNAGVRFRDCSGQIQDMCNDFVKDFGKNYNFDFANYSPSEDYEKREADESNGFVRKQVGKMLRASIVYVRSGWWVRGSVYGYKLERIETNEGKKTILVPDPIEAEYVKQLFEMRAKGYPDVKIADELNKVGCRSRTLKRRDPRTQRALGTKGGNPMTTKAVQQIVARTIYAGITCEKWTDWKPVKANFKGLISIDLFNIANRGKVEIRQDSDGQYKICTNTGEALVKKKRNKNNKKYLFRGLLLCPECLKHGEMRTLTASHSQGKSGQKFAYYHCRGYKKTFVHTQYSLRQGETDEEITNAIDDLRFTDELSQLFEMMLRLGWQEHTKKN